MIFFNHFIIAVCLIFKFSFSFLLSYLVVDTLAHGGTRGGSTGSGRPRGKGPKMDFDQAPGDFMGEGGPGDGFGRFGEGLKELGLGYLREGKRGFISGDFVINIICPVVEDEPTCTRPFMNGKNGTWVYRTLYHPITGMARNSSLCIHSDIALDTDDCGCCDPGGCPEQCLCKCNDNGGVLVEGPSKPKLVGLWNCVSSHKSLSSWLPPWTISTVIRYALFRKKR
jgi:hypothetical protein